MARSIDAAAAGARLGADAARAARSPGRPTCSRSRCRTGRSIRRSSSSPWFTFQLDLVRSLWAMLPAPSSGARASRSRWPRSPTAAGSGAAGRRRLRRQHRRRHRRRARPRACCWSVWLGSQRAQQLLIVLSVMAALLALDARSDRASATAARDRGSAITLRSSAPRRRRRSRATSAPCPAFSSPTAATRRPRSARPTSSTWAKAGTPRSRVRGSRTACSTTTTPARCRPRASRRTCACSACSAT